MTFENTEGCIHHPDIHFQFLNNIIRIFIHIFTYTYFHTCFQTTKHMYQIPPKYFNTHEESGECLK